jgi:hypothetical protein
MSDRVANWKSVIHKIVRSNGGNLIGNVDAVDENSILVSTELNIQKAKLERFKGAAGEGFREISNLFTR